MKTKAVALMFLAKITRNVACLSAFLALSASAAVKADGTTEVIFEVKPVVSGVTVSGIAGFEDKSFESFAAAYEAIKPIVEKLGLGQEGATVEQFDALFTAVDANGDATITYTISGNVVYDETNCENLLSMGRKASHYGNGRHLINFKFIGKTGKDADTLTVNSNLTLPYEWWSEKKTTGIHFENLTLTGSAPNGLYAYQSYFEGIDFSVANCMLKGLKIYNCSNVPGSYSITDSVLDGTGAPADSYAIHLQGNETAPLAVTIKGNTITGYDRGVNIDQKTAVATISGNTISVNDTGRSCIQLTQLAETTVSGNTLNLTGGNAITLHENLLNLAVAPKISVMGNTIEGKGYLVYDDAAANGKAFTADNLALTYGTDNTVAETVDTTKGVKGSTVVSTSVAVNNVIQHYVATVGETGYASLADALAAAKDGETVTLLADATEDVAVATSVTLDLGGKTLTNAGAGKVTLTIAEGATVTVKNGTLADNVPSAGRREAGVKPEATGAKVALENVVVETTGAYGVATSGSNKENDVTLVGTTIRAANGVGVYFPSTGTLTIDGGAITGLTGVQVCAGRLLISGEPTITATGAGQADIPSSGAVLDGAAVSVVIRTGYGAFEGVTISGGQFTSATGVEALQAYAVNGTEKTAWEEAAEKVGVSGGTFSSAVLPEYCAAGFIPTANDDGTYGVRATFAIAAVKVSADSDKTIDIRVPYALLENVAGETQEEQFANLSEPDANGNLAWVNLVAGIDPAQKVRMTAPQNSEPDVIDVDLPTVGEAPEGTDVTVRYEIRADGSDAAVVSSEEAEDLVINLNGKAGIGTYRAYVCLLQNGTEVARVASENALGVLQTVRAAKKTIIAVPWLSLTDGNAIAVADFVKTAGLTAGDKLHIYNKSENRYDVYELTTDKAWAPKAIYKVGADGTVETASSGTPETTTVARGSGVWLERQDTTQPIVSYGQVASATVATTIDAGTTEKKAWNLLAVPTTTAIDIATTFGTDTADEIIVPTDGAPKVCTVKDGAWGYDKTVSVTDKFGNETGVRIDREAVTELPAGTGFWYLNGGAAKTVNW